MAHVKLVLLADIDNLGLAGEEVSVAPGYARNYLIPRGYAAKATAGILRQLESRKAEIEARRAQERSAADQLAAKLGELNLEIPMQASDDNQLFGSVTPRIIAEALAKAGLTVDRAKIVIVDPIKTLGEFTVEVKVHAAVRADLKLTVVRH